MSVENESDGGEGSEPNDKSTIREEIITVCEHIESIDSEPTYSEHLFYQEREGSKFYIIEVSDSVMDEVSGDVIQVRDPRIQPSLIDRIERDTTFNVFSIKANSEGRPRLELAHSHEIEYAGQGE